MNDQANARHDWLNGWRIAGWGAALALLALPAIAMHFTDEVHWTPLDFGFAAVLLFALGTGLELAIRFGGRTPKGLGIAIASVAGFLTLWANFAVGFIGAESEPVNAGFLLLVIGGVLLSLIVRFRPSALRWIMALIATGQPVLGVAALWLMPGHAVEWGVLFVFAAIWSAAALCFHRAHRRATH
ncbi:hypothetical protein Q9K02_13600 [Qipengyuania sp. G39]|uniref:DUF308 domain-containing protein n=1 Tax=Qipengyuania profundimaris TaxID=3067652 RepID=A0ABT9HSN9_9SPHN|nr:hypothetical protein [Qipengyuania sp. G39]MDP4576172.1 hypothetical protein [Qipengyuania sp. G39]